MVIFKQYQISSLYPVWSFYRIAHWKFLMFRFIKFNIPKDIIENKMKHPQYKTTYADWALLLGFFAIKRWYSKKEIEEIKNHY